MVHGCSCYRSYTVDNQYYGTLRPPSHSALVDVDAANTFYNYSLFYRQDILTHAFGTVTPELFPFVRMYVLHFALRGPYAFAATDWIGYDCSHALCPQGDNPFADRGEVKPPLRSPF